MCVVALGLVNVSGLMALSRVNVSFSEAVKSTTPLFTVRGKAPNGIYIHREDL